VLAAGLSCNVTIQSLHKSRLYHHYEMYKLSHRIPAGKYFLLM
jgi:hypothetical protein